VKQLKIGSSSIRGVVGNGLTPELAADFACAFGAYMDRQTIVLARDTRRSSPMIASAVFSGLVSTGCDVIDAKVCPTPVAQYLVRNKEAAGAVVVTGSHNDSRWNALKFINRDGALLNAIQGEELLDLYHLGEFEKASWDMLGKRINPEGYVKQYIESNFNRLNVEAIRDAGFRVVVDLTNGAAAMIVPELLSYLGCKPVLINEETTGDFAHAPGPTPANMRQLSSLLKHIEANIGFAFNSDADSVGVVTEEGKALSEECTLPLVADHLLNGNKAKVVTNLSTSMMIEDVVNSRGGKLIRTKIGEGNVIFTAMNENAYLAGEGSGGVACLPFGHAFDGFMSAAFILESMALSNMTVSDLRRRLPSFHMRKGVVTSSSARIYNALEEVRRLSRKEVVDLTDGVRITWPGRWLHVRASNTEPLIRIIAEGEDRDKVDDIFNDAMRRVNTVVHGKS